MSEGAHTNEFGELIPDRITVKPVETQADLYDYAYGHERGRRDATWFTDGRCRYVEQDFAYKSAEFVRGYWAGFKGAKWASYSTWSSR